MDCPAVSTSLELLDSAVLPAVGMPQKDQPRWQLPQAVVQERNVKFSLVSGDNGLALSPVAAAPPPIVAPPPVATPPPVVSQALSQQQTKVGPASLPPSQSSSVDFSFSLADDMMHELNAAPPPAAAQPSSSAKSVPSLEEDGGVLAMVKVLLRL